jgi:hypothetical protein
MIDIIGGKALPWLFEERCKIKRVFRAGRMMVTALKRVNGRTTFAAIAYSL